MAKKVREIRAAARIGGTVSVSERLWTAGEEASLRQYLTDRNDGTRKLAAVAKEWIAATGSSRSRYGVVFRAQSLMAWTSPPPVFVPWTPDDDASLAAFAALHPGQSRTTVASMWKDANPGRNAPPPVFAPWTTDEDASLAAFASQHPGQALHTIAAMWKAANPGSTRTPTAIETRLRRLRQRT